MPRSRRWRAAGKPSSSPAVTSWPKRVAAACSRSRQERRRRCSPCCCSSRVRRPRHPAWRTRASGSTAHPRYTRRVSSSETAPRLAAAVEPDSAVSEDESLAVKPVQADVSTPAEPVEPARAEAGRNDDAVAAEGWIRLISRASRRSATISHASWTRARCRRSSTAPPSVLDASGIILWIADPDGRELNPIFAQGYPQQLVNRLGTIPRDAENATAAAFRTSLLQTVMADQISPARSPRRS